MFIILCSYLIQEQAEEELDPAAPESNTLFLMN